MMMNLINGNSNEFIYFECKKLLQNNNGTFKF